MDTNNHPSGQAPDAVTQHLLIRGGVQGVGFRWSMCAKANALGLSGWVRNRHDGSVEALAHGPVNAVAALVEWAHHGPAGARVVALEVVAVDAAVDAAVETTPARNAFEQRPTV
jgi:acylphosphatase